MIPVKKALIVGGAAVVGAAAAAGVAAVVYDKVAKNDDPCATCEGGDCDTCGNAAPDEGAGGQTEEPGDTAQGVDPDAGVMPGGAVFTPTQAVTEG